ncbi:MAG: TatD family hydrolase, partial [Nitrospirae bacterium]|nr:TatD family hydrolase [Nitrospirota bacterium]
RILVETDCPYLTPTPYRGKRNEPSYVRYVVDKVAEVRGMTPADVAGMTMANACRLFGIRF